MFLNRHSETVFWPSEKGLLCIRNKLKKRNLLGSFKIEKQGFFSPILLLLSQKLHDLTFHVLCLLVFIPYCTGNANDAARIFLWRWRFFLWRMIKIKLPSLSELLNCLMMLTVFRDRNENSLLVLLFQKMRYGR